MGKVFIVLCTLIFGFCGRIYAQNIKIILGPDEVGLNQAFTITLEVENDRIKDYGEFPNIPGFQKMGTSSSSSTNIINGQYSYTQSVTQNYRPQQEGVYTLRPFNMEVNGQQVNSPGKKIKVGAPVQQQRKFDPFSYDPFEDFFGNKEPQNFVDVKDDAFLALSVDKDQVYVGEGLTVSLGFYVAESNRAELSFYETGQQLADIKKMITPSNCWEENFNIERLNREDVIINNRRYGRYKIFQATFYPFNTDTIYFPAVPLKMIKYKVAKNPSFFGRNRQEDYKTYYSKPKRILVKELPPFPLRESVPVGRYRLSDKISSKTLTTGQSFNYQFNVVGEGNISAIDKPNVKNSDNFEFYPPNIHQNINRSNNHVRGSKSFDYYAIPNEPGEYNIGDYIQLIYFDPAEARYDTLKSDITVKVVGESKKNVSISSNDLGTFYNLIDLESNKLVSLHHDDLIKLITNIFIFLMLGLTVYYIFKR